MRYYIKFTALGNKQFQFLGKGIDSEGVEVVSDRLIIYPHCNNENLAHKDNFTGFFKFMETCKALKFGQSGMTDNLLVMLIGDWNQPKEIIESEFKKLFSYEWARLVPKDELQTSEDEALQAVADLFADHDVHGDIASGPRM